MTSESEEEKAGAGWVWAGLLDNLPFVAIIVLGLIGSGWASISRTPTARYWVVVTPIIAVICIVAGWRHTLRGERVGMVVTQALQWAAVLIAMYLLTISTVEQSLSSTATGLMLLTVLALGVFVSGLDLRSWKLCVTGAFLAVSVPAIAWIQHAALLLLLVGLALIGLLFLYWWLRDRTSAAP
jgi:hypothetical protein